MTATPTMLTATAIQRAAVGRLLQPEDADHGQPHRRGVLKEDGVGGRADGHGGDVEGVHGREADGRAEHGGADEDRAAQQRQQGQSGEQGAAECEL